MDSVSEHIRKLIFLFNKERITKHNRDFHEGKTSYMKGRNQFSDKVSLQYLIH